MFLHISLRLKKHIVEIFMTAKVWNRRISLSKLKKTLAKLNKFGTWKTGRKPSVTGKVWRPWKVPSRVTSHLILSMFALYKDGKMHFPSFSISLPQTFTIFFQAKSTVLKDETLRGTRHLCCRMKTCSSRMDMFFHTFENSTESSFFS